MKQVRFGATTAIANGPDGFNSLAQSWWGEQELLQSYQQGLDQALLGQAEPRGLESHFQKGNQHKRNGMYVKYVVRRSQKMPRTPEAELVLAQYASKNTRVHQVKAQQRAFRDQEEARKVHTLPASKRSTLPAIAKVNVNVNRPNCVPIVANETRRCTVARVISC